MKSDTVENPTAESPETTPAVAESEPSASGNVRPSRAAEQEGETAAPAPAKTSIAKAKVTTSKRKLYNGKRIKPKVKVVLHGKKLKLNRDFKVKQRVGLTRYMCLMTSFL